MKYDKQIKAKELRLQGMSIGHIAKELDVSKSSVSVWVQDVQITPEQTNTLIKNRHSGSIQAAIVKRNKYLKQRKLYQEEGRNIAREKDLLYCMGCMLFWAEGSKNKNTITFTNSDPNMILLFVKFLTEKLNIKNNEISMRINCFLQKVNDINKVHDYWINLLHIDGCSIQKPTTKITKNTIDNYGVCTIIVFNTKLAQQLYGAIQEYGGFSNDMCLNNKRSRKY